MKKYLDAETTWRMMDIAAYTFVIGCVTVTGEMPTDEEISTNARAIMSLYCSSEGLVPCYEGILDPIDDEDEDDDYYEEDEW